MCGPQKIYNVYFAIGICIQKLYYHLFYITSLAQQDEAIEAQRRRLTSGSYFGLFGRSCFGRVLFNHLLANIMQTLPYVGRCLVPYVIVGTF